MWDNPFALSNAGVYEKMKRRLSDQYIQHYFARDTYATSGLNGIKSSYVCSPYLSLVHSPSIRSILTKIRIGNIPKLFKYETNERKCPLCLTKEDEIIIHVFLKCRSLISIRNAFDTDMEYIIHNYGRMTDKEKILLILDLKTERIKNQNNSSDFITKVTSYLKSIYIHA